MSCFRGMPTGGGLLGTRGGSTPLLVTRIRPDMVLTRRLCDNRSDVVMVTVEVPVAYVLSGTSSEYRRQATS